MPPVSAFEFRLAVQPVPLCPEIRLRLLCPEVDLDADARDFLGEHAPFWAFCWASGQVLARYLLDHPELVRGQRVVDFGTGSGVVGIAAALAGAERVTVCDSDPHALEAARLNAAHNAVDLDFSDQTSDRRPGDPSAQGPTSQVIETGGGRIHPLRRDDADAGGTDAGSQDRRLLSRALARCNVLYAEDRTG